VTDFKKTVEKIAASPWKRGIFSILPQLLYKEAGFGSTAERIFGEGGAQSVAKNVASGAATAGVLALGGYGGARLLGDSDAQSDRIKGRQSTLGKLEGERKWRDAALSKLQPMHESTFSGLQADPILSKADPALINSSYETMKRFAPNLAADPNATRAFLQESAVYGKGPSYATLKTLADAERAVQQTQGYGA